MALRAVGASPGGLRIQAYPSFMPGLVEMGLVEERHVRWPGRSQPAWFLTKAGRDMLAEVGKDERRPARAMSAEQKPYIQALSDVRSYHCWQIS